MSNSQIYGFQSRKIDGRCLFQIESKSTDNQPVYVQFAGALGVNHLFTLPAEQSYTVILEAEATLHYPSNLELTIHQVESYCRFDFKLINQSELFELPIPPITDFSRIGDISNGTDLAYFEGFRYVDFHNRLLQWKNTNIYNDDGGFHFQGVSNSSDSVSTYEIEKIINHNYWDLEILATVHGFFSSTNIRVLHDVDESEIKVYEPNSAHGLTKGYEFMMLPHRNRIIDHHDSLVETTDALPNVDDGALMRWNIIRDPQSMELKRTNLTTGQQANVSISRGNYREDGRTYLQVTGYGSQFWVHNIKYNLK